MLQMIFNVIGTALFLGIYAYALSVEPPPTPDTPPSSGRGCRALARA